MVLSLGADRHRRGLESAAGLQTPGKNLLVSVTLVNSDTGRLEGKLVAELLGPEDKVVDHLEKTVDQRDKAEAYRFEFPTPTLPIDQVTVRYTFGKQKLKKKLGTILLKKAHETVLTAGQEFHAGSKSFLRCEVRGVKSLTETVPLAGASVEVQLRGKERSYKLFSGKVGTDGVAKVPFSVPALPAGAYKMEVVTRSGLGEEKLEREVKIKDEHKVLLVTDKPLYQPGQVIHIRALSLGAFDLKPVAKSKLVFEVEDSKGNKVFKREHETSEYGVAAVDFQLASEVNTGDYRVRAILDKTQADKTVTVKPYVLPKFKGEVTADKKFYLPKEVVKADLQTDYFFGKPVAKAKVKVTASTFDVAFKDFATWEGTTDERGHAKFEVKLPNYFVGQPLVKGNALVRLEVKVTDTADHSETFTRTYTVSDQPIKVSLIPEAGRLVPGVENRVFAAAIYPDGSPARCDVKVWLGKETKGNPLAKVKTSEAGLAEFAFTPEAKQFRPGDWGMQNVEVLGGTRQIWAAKNLLDLTAEAKDAKGEKAAAIATLSSDPLGENVLLRLDKAVYRGGDNMTIDVRTSAGLPTVYLDLVKNGQTLLTEWLAVKDGKALKKVTLPAEAFGTLEVHAYQMLASGEIIRDGRVVYVQPPSDLNIKVKPNKDVYKPGDNGSIRFEVTDSAGKPTAAALGVLIVDEAVYALQEMQPGLEKVYFTLQEELMKPQAQAVYKPSETINDLVLRPELPPEKQQVAQVLLTSVRPKPPARWDVDPAQERRRQFEGNLQQIGWALWNYAFQGKEFLEQDKESKHWRFKDGLLDELVKMKWLNENQLKDPLGGQLSLDGLARLEKDFTADRLARAYTSQRIQQLVWPVAQQANAHRAQWFKDKKWEVPAKVIDDAAKAVGDPRVARDAWGGPIKLVKRAGKLANPTGHDLYNTHELVSAGPDGKFDTADDVKQSVAIAWNHGAGWWGDQNLALDGFQLGDGGRRWGRQLQRRNLFADFDRAAMKDGLGGPLGGGGGFQGGFGGGGALPMAQGAPGRGGAGGPTLLKAAEAAVPTSESTPGADSGGAQPTRLREFFPETMFWKPALITNERGVADLSVDFADSITTWRLTASASSKGGLLGGVSAPLKVFQDFFVDLDLPVALTQNDEVAFPVAVYNYLKTPQTLKIELQKEDWFELVGDTPTRSLDLKPGEVTSVKFRIRARKLWTQHLTVKARGSKASDAIKREIEVLPDGKKIEVTSSDRLAGKVTKVIDIPANAVPDASKLIVKVYPGVFSQILEGVDGLIRLPGG
ncbi:MAG: hypothetical protein HYS12_11820 [Planctomycetes bacterium]|nr:hypothetical protein [Planctomycetota bacterium]